MNELQLQDKYLVNFLCERRDGLLYRESKANTVSSELFLEADLISFLSETELNKDNYKRLLRDYAWDEKRLIQELTEELIERRKDATNIAIFINNNKTFTFPKLNGYKFHLFYPSGWEIDSGKLFDKNIFSVVQEFTYAFKYEGKTLYTFRPDICFFVNGIFFGYSELKSNYNNQTAQKQGRKKVVKDYLEASLEYLKIAHGNDVSQSIRKDFLKIFEKAIHITVTDFWETYVIRNIAKYLDDIKILQDEWKYDFDDYKNKVLSELKPYPVSDKKLDKVERFEEVFRSLYSKEMIEKEILYYNFIEREVVKIASKKETKNEKWVLIAPRPKQKFGTDKIIAKIDEFLEHEQEDDYFINKLKRELSEYGISEERKQELIEKRQKYQNNKNIYSLLLQYAAGFWKSNIIGWSTLQLKDLKKNGEYVYDKVMIIVDRIQLRDQIGDKMFNMNVNNKMYIEVSNKKEFIEALASDTRICIVNIQKFWSIREILTSDIIEKLTTLRIAFLIDEIHRSNSWAQHEEMISLFDELQASFENEKYIQSKKKKNLIVGFTATPSDHTLARFWEYNKYAESEKLWVPFDSYTMREAIEDGYILNPLKWIIPVATKMHFELPDDILEGFEGDTWYDEITDDEDTGIDAEWKKYAIRKKKIYLDDDRIEDISKFIVDMLVTTVYPKIRWTAKAMLAVSSIKSAIKYKHTIDKLYDIKTQEKKYQRFENAPIYIVYSSNQEYTSASTLNDGLTEEKVLQNFSLAKNWLMIVVDKLQTWFDEPKLQTLFLDKEISGINAIQTISRVNRTTKYKNDCKIVDFSYKNVNVSNIKKAFEHFSNVVVSDFDPLGEERILWEIYTDLISSHPHQNNFEKFQLEILSVDNQAHKIISIQNSFNTWIKNHPKNAKTLKTKINQYFRILNNIEYVIGLEERFNEKIFLEFWRRFNYEYNVVNKVEDIVDDVIIYYDNKIGIIDTHIQDDGLVEKEKKKVKAKKDSHESKQYRFNILDVIKKRNEAEEKIEELIKQFEGKIQKLFEFIMLPENGRRLIAKIKDRWNAFSEEEIYRDFELIYKKYVRRNRSELGEFFVKETQWLTNKLCDDFEEELLFNQDR